MVIRATLTKKMLCTISVILLVAMSIYTLIAASIFRKEKAALLFEINHSSAVNHALQIRSALAEVFQELREGAVSTVESKRLDILDEALFSGVDEAQEKFAGRFHVSGFDGSRLMELEEDQNRERSLFWKEKGEEDRYFLAVLLEVEDRGDVRHPLAVAEISLKFFFDHFQAANIYRSYLLTESGQVLFSAEGSDLLEVDSLEGHPILADLKRGTEFHTGVKGYERDQNQWYGAFAPVGYSSLFVVSEANHSEILVAQRTLAKTSLLYGLILLTLGVLVGQILSHKLTVGVRTLTESAKNIEEGKPVDLTPIESGDEVETLSRAFNGMVKELQKRQTVIEAHNRELESKVRERTKELEIQTEAVKEAKDQLLKTTQSATAAEVAGWAAHEVLNPLSALRARTEEMHSVLQRGTEANQHLEALLSAWKTEIHTMTLPVFLNGLSLSSQANPEETVFDEDLTLLNQISIEWRSKEMAWLKDSEFLLSQCERIHKILAEMKEKTEAKTEKKEGLLIDLIEKTLLTLSGILERNQCELEQELRLTTAVCFLNEGEFIQILSNLIENAIQAMSGVKATIPGQKKRVVIRVYEDGDYTNIDVVDWGPGVSKEVESRLFVHGFSTHHKVGPSNKAPGTGLGLSICRRYARAFGGEVSFAYSEPKARGTCFRLSVPLLQSANALAA